MNTIHFKVSTGLACELCKAYTEAKRAVLAQVDALAAKHKACPGKSLARGTFVEGLYFGGGAPKGWKPDRKFHGFYTPNKKSKLGREIAQELEAIRAPCADKLAVDLGCKPFFTDFDTGAHLCASIGVMEHAGVYYLEANKWCRPDVKRFPQIAEIPASEWHLANEERIAVERQV